MLRLLNKFIILTFCLTIYLSCEFANLRFEDLQSEKLQFSDFQFADLRPIKITIEPNEINSLLDDAYSPVIVKFNTEMEKEHTEGILQVNSDSGVVRGDLSWVGSDLYFVPVSGWTAGTRYTLSLSGTVRAVDGRELRVEHFVSFFAINKNSPPLLEWFTPADGESVSTGNVVPEFHFSCSMNKLSVESALTIEGIGNKTFEWLADDSIIRVIPEKAPPAWISCRWTLKNSAKSIDGIPLQKTYSGQFITDLDKIFPKVEKVYPVINSGASWYPTGANIETGLGRNQSIAVEFNKPMGENVLRSLRFEPSLTGRTELLSEKSVVFIISKDPEPQTSYTLIVSGDTRDSEGLKIGADYRINFSPDIPFLKILSFTSNNNQAVLTDFSSINNVITVPVNHVTTELNFSIHFSLPFDVQEKQNAALKIMLSSFFPRITVPVTLQFVLWTSDDRLQMTWEGLEAGTSDEPHYYKLLIPGGKNGIYSSGGIYMKEDIIIYLEAVK